MRNLALKSVDCRTLGNVKNCEAFCFNFETLFAYDKGIIAKYDGSIDEVICNLADTLYPSENDIPKAVELIYHYEKNLIYLILSNGDIISTETERNSSETIVGSVDDGIKAGQWSPEQEVIALVSGADNVIVLTNDFDPISEVNLHGGGFGEKQIVSVGWGKKETQFQGSAGKYVAQEKPEEMQLARSDTIHISWRGDAEYFAVSCINPETNIRYLRIFSKGGILQYTSETLNGLEDCLDWRPSGNLIASTQRLPNKYNVCFLEKNGLKHGEFSLPFSHSACEVTQISWSRDSKILAVFVTDHSSEEMKQNDHATNNKYILLFTVSNYKWYCKYKLTFKVSNNPLYIQWDHQTPGVFHVVSKRNDSIYHNKYTWNWITNKSNIFNAEGESLVGVIDGCNVQITSFKKGIVPPPMCTYKIIAPSFVNSLSFAPDSSNNLLLHLSNGNVLIYKFVDSKDINHELIGTIKFENSDEMKTFYNCQWIESKKLVTNLIHLNGGMSDHYMSVINLSEMDDIIKYERKDILMSSSVAMVKASEACAIIYDNSGKFYNFKGNEMSEIEMSENKCILDMDILERNGQPFVISLDSSNKFYVDSKLLFNNVLSFHVHEKFILLTNMKHELLCLNSDDLSCVESLPEIFKRRVERGSRLVTSVHKDTKVILQMPRGNLECIQPRVLSVYTVGKYLDSLSFDKAFDLMRKQRINLNLIYDHNPKSFSDNLTSFVEQINDPQWLSLFISDLIEEDVTTTLYSVIYKSNNKLTSSENSENKSKIDALCDQMEKVLSGPKYSEKYLLPLITCHIKRNKIESLEKALSIIKNLKEREDRGEKLLVSFNEAFRYLLYLIDVEEIYKIALGMYDFDLVLMVAEKSQKDPKEYLPFLNDLKHLEPHYQRFTIDKYLKRYHKALTNLVLCDGDDKFNECLSFIKAHKLYKTALKLIARNTDRYKRVCLSYGEDLMKSNLFEEAGIMFCNAGMYRNAIEAYRRSGNWHEILNCTNELDLGTKELNKLYFDVANDLVEAKEYSMAAIIYLDYLRDVEEAVKVLANGKLFAEAYRICHVHNSPDLVAKVIVPAIVQQAHLTILQIAEFKNTFTKQRQRLQVVRQKKVEIDSRKETEIDSDVYSEASTIITQSHATSRGTNRTYRSAKNKRKQERKLLSLKEGSPYEHLALVVSLHNSVTTSFALMPEVKEINKFLVKINHYEMAEKLQKDFDEFIKIIQESKSEIWTPELFGDRKQNFGPDATSNDIASVYVRSENVAQNLLEPKYAIPPEMQSKIKWKLDII